MSALYDFIPGDWLAPAVGLYVAFRLLRWGFSPLIASKDEQGRSEQEREAWEAATSIRGAVDQLEPKRRRVPAGTCFEEK